MISDVISKLSNEGKVGAEQVISLSILNQVHESSDRVRSWLKYEIFLTKILVTGVVSAEEFESAVLPLLKSEMDANMLSKFGSCLKGAVSSFRKTRSSYRDEEFVQLLEWISWLCSPAADVV